MKFVHMSVSWAEKNGLDPRINIFKFCFNIFIFNVQKQPSRGLLRRMCSTNLRCFATLLKSHVGMGVLL